MADFGVSISAQGARELKELSKKLRQKKELRKKLRSAIAAAGKPVVADVKQAVLALNVTSHGGGSAQRRSFAVSKAKTARAKTSAAKRSAGLRHTIASATNVQITAKGIRIRVSGSKLPPDQQSLPRHLDSSKGWRHPTFGRSPWVNQKGGPYFASTIKKKAPAFRRAVLNAMDEIAKDIDS
jgi:hypothetical protein